MWRQGETSAPGIQQIAETGDGDIFLEEVEACGDSCGDPMAIECSPMSGVCNGTGILVATPAYPYISTAAMLAPSPDWCAHDPGTNKLSSAIARNVADVQCQLPANVTNAPPRCYSDD